MRAHREGVEKAEAVLRLEHLMDGRLAAQDGQEGVVGVVRRARGGHRRGVGVLECRSAARRVGHRWLLKPPLGHP